MSGYLRVWTIFALAVLLGTGCAGNWGDDDDVADDAGAADDDPAMPDDDGSPDDNDHDGYSPADGDCDDDNAGIHPGAQEHENGVDDDCDGQIDEDFDDWDLDGDGFSAQAGDCDDNNPGVHPGAEEHSNGVDDDCDGIIDNHTPEYDDDGDGFNEYDGDCDDYDPSAYPGATEVPGDGVDNDCNGAIDEAIECDCPTTSSPAAAIDVCTGLHNENLTGYGSQTSITASYGSAISPRFGCQLYAMHTGMIGEDPTQLGTDMGTSITEWDFTGYSVNCGSQPPPGTDTKRDQVGMELVLNVPANAQSFSVDFLFVSSEYEEWVCTQFNDTFEIYLESSALDPSDFPDHDGDGIPEGNVAFDATGKPITVNNNYFIVTDCAVMYNITGFSGQGFALEPGFPPAVPCTGPTGNTNDAGATGWLTTTAPVTPGETITLGFSIWDEGDGIYDSMVFIDNFYWDTVPIGDPETD